MTPEQQLQAQIDEAWRTRVLVPCPGVMCGYAATRVPRATCTTIVCGWCRSRFELDHVDGVRVWRRFAIVDPKAEHA